MKKVLTTYVVLLRGINVGGKNKVPMAELKMCLAQLGFIDVITYIASGNVILKSAQSAEIVKDHIEKALPVQFKLDSDLIKVLVLTSNQLEAIVAQKPKDFGDHPEKYYSDVIFLLNMSSDEALKVFNPRAGVDKIWQGDSVIYSQRLSSRRTQSRLSKIAVSPLYKSMTIRSWNTTTKLLMLLNSKRN